MKRKTIQLISQLLAQIENCELSNNLEHKAIANARLRDIETNHLPSGSGIDNGTTICRESSTPDKVVLFTSYHHMNEGGYYDGWTQHKITVTPAFDRFHIKVGGKNRNDIKDHLWDTFFFSLDAEIDA